MRTDNDFGTFFLPGPTEVRREVLEAMLKPMIPHRSAEFEELFAKLQDGLRRVFLTRRPVYIAASSGTGMMEAAIRALPPGRILSLVNGAFSERFAHISEMCGRQTQPPLDRDVPRHCDRPMRPAVVAITRQDGGRIAG